MADPRQDVVRAMTRALSLVKRETFVLNFLFSSDLPSLSAMLTNPAAFAASITGHYEDAFIDLEGMGYHGLFDSTASFQNLFVPVVSSGPLVLGVAITGQKPTPATLNPFFTPPSSNTVDVPGATNFLVGRYVRSNETGDLLLVMRPAGHAGCSTPSFLSLAAARPKNSLQIFSYAFKSTCLRERTLFVCDADKIPSQFRSSDTVDLIPNAVVLMQETFEKRFCPLCKRSPNVSCNCDPRRLLPLTGSGGAFDEAQASGCLKSHLGALLGNGRVIFAPSAPSAHYLAQAAPAPAPAPAPAAAFISSPALLSRVNIRGWSFRWPEAHGRIAHKFRDFAVKLSIASRSPLDAVMPFAATGYGVGQSVVDGCYAQGQAGHMLCSPVGARAPPGFYMYPAATIAPTLAPLSAIAPLHSSIDPYLRDDGEGAAMCAGNVGVAVRGRSAGGGVASRLVAARKSPASQGSSKDPKSSGGSVSGKVRGEVEDKERLARVALRKTRNREAAARSNKKRKEKNDGLKTSIIWTQAHVIELRVREAELKAANAVLRSQAVKLGLIRAT